MIGVDEVGRGCLAGPLLVVAARQLAELPAGLNDSKQLTRRQREHFFKLLHGVCEFGEGWVKPAEIDRLGLTKATSLGVRRALRKLGAEYGEEIIIDGNYNYIPKTYRRVTTMVDADALIPLVSAASIFAKVRRDAHMRELAVRYPAYGFETNAGYGTSLHLSAISKLGSIRYLHRQSYAPLSLDDKVAI